MKEWITSHIHLPRVKEWISSHIYGILGTIIVHLFLAIVFMVFKISTFKPDTESPVIITFEPDKPPPAEDATTDHTYTDAEIDKLIHNIAVNRALTQDEDFDINDYINQVKEEMIEKGELGKDNFIDQWRKEQEEADGELSAKLPEKKLSPDSSISTSEIMASNYNGPTRVEYYLKNRLAKHIEIPIYKCEGSGMVIMEIEVDRTGQVTSATPVKDKSTTNACMLEAAHSAALLSTFNRDNRAPVRVTGTITYYFVAQ